MLAKSIVSKKNYTELSLSKHGHTLIILPFNTVLPEANAVPGLALLGAALQRRQLAPSELAKQVICTDTQYGGLIAWMMLDAAASTFIRHAQLRAACMALLDEHPEDIALVAVGDEAFRHVALHDASYVALVNGVRLPEFKSAKSLPILKKITIYGADSQDFIRKARAIAGGNALCRALTVTPANLLTPHDYRKRIADMAVGQGWQHQEYDLKKLRKMGAGAFVAVAQGSHEQDAAIVHLRREHPNAQASVALVGKGICFDTGGHNLKSARYMHGMHEDMNGSAVALGILQAVTELDLPFTLDVWLAIAQNHLSPEAYKQNDVVTALNGTHIEIIHTDAEGRMALADTLTLAARTKPEVIVDFATLTGSMVTALGTRYSGVLSNRPSLLAQAITAGVDSGERVCGFPMDVDYEPALDSKVADIKQCTLDGEADHILAARFLNHFVDDIPWLHVDLSACNCKEGLGAVATDVTGFGVAWGVAWLAGYRT